jgi:hypothetical protein
MKVLDSVRLGQKVTIDHVVDQMGRESYMVCSKGMCRIAEDQYMATTYAQHFGCNPQLS